MSDSITKTVQIPLELSVEIDAAIRVQAEMLGDPKSWDFSKFARMAFRNAVAKYKTEGGNNE